MKGIGQTFLQLLLSIEIEMTDSTGLQSFTDSLWGQMPFKNTDLKM